MKPKLFKACVGPLLAAFASGCLWISEPDAGEAFVRATDLAGFRASNAPLSTSSIKPISDLGAEDALLIGVAPDQPLVAGAGQLRAVFVLAGRGVIYLDDAQLKLEPDLLITFPPQKSVRIEAGTPLRLLGLGPSPTPAPRPE